MRPLFVNTESSDAFAVRLSLQNNIVGQEEAVDALVDITEKYHANIFDPTKPISSNLLIGPTGSGKTRLCEAFAEALYGDPKQMLKIDCAEYQHSAEIAKLLGSPPGYIGHRETPPLLTQERIDKFKTTKYSFAVILWDEIEKASDALWHLMLGILDKGRITLGNNTETDLTRTVNLMTSNAGSSEMEFALRGGAGFRPTEEITVDDDAIKSIGVESAKRKFTSEFINRVDGIIACNALTKEQIKGIIEIELRRLQHRIFSKCSPALAFHVSGPAKQAILDEGYDPKYNARNVKRVIERRVGKALSRIIATKQCKPKEEVLVDFKNGGFSFSAV